MESLEHSMIKMKQSMHLTVCTNNLMLAFYYVM